MASETVDVDSICPTCSTPIRLGKPVVFAHGDVLHLACGSRAMTLRRSMELRELTAEIMARAVDAVARAKRLVMQYGPRLSCPVCAKRIAGRDGAIRQGDTYVHLGCAPAPRQSA